MNTEIWRPVIGYNGLYEVSNLGNIRSLDMLLPGRNNNLRLKKGQMIKLHLDKYGYFKVSLCRKTFKVHRIVAEAFLENPNKYSEINHIDLNKTNNNILNLEWCDRKMNFKHSVDNNKQATSITSNCSKAIVQLDLQGNPINYFYSSRQAERVTTISNATISKVCKGLGNTAGGFRWKYLNERIDDSLMCKEYIKNI